MKIFSFSQIDFRQGTGSLHLCAVYTTDSISAGVRCRLWSSLFRLKSCRLKDQPFQFFQCWTQKLITTFVIFLAVSDMQFSFISRYCAHFEITHTKGSCNMRNKYQGWTQMFSAGQTVCVECQPLAMKRKLGVRCSGDGIYLKVKSKPATQIIRAWQGSDSNPSKSKERERETAENRQTSFRQTNRQNENSHSRHEAELNVLAPKLSRWSVWPRRALMQ